MAVDFAAGCIGGAAGIAVGFPLDTVKVRIQTQDISKGVKYKSTFGCLATIIREEGVKSLYRGMASPLYGVAAMNAIGFGVYGNVIRRLNNPDSITSITTAGVAAGGVQAFIASPMELIKTQMQVHSDTNGPVDVVKKIYNTAGFRGLATGLGITIAREVPACGLYFSSYELMVKLNPESTPWVFAAGGISGMISWAFTYPQDVIKSKIQADNLGRNSTYKGYVHCYKMTVAQHGYGILTRGMASSLIRAFPVNAVTMGTVTMILRIMGEDVSVAEAVRRLHLNDSFHIEASLKLPDQVQDYFEWGKRSRSVDAMLAAATDGPNIIQIAKPNMFEAPYRRYVENILFATPTKFSMKDPKEVEVGTARANVSPLVLLHFFDRLVRKLLPQPKVEEEDDHDFSILVMGSHELSDNAGADFVLDNKLDHVMIALNRPKTLESKAKQKMLFEDDGSNIYAPSILAREHGQILGHRKETITTSDFLLPANLLSSSKDKIYGFYYVT